MLPVSISTERMDKKFARQLGSHGEHKDASATLLLAGATICSEFATGDGIAPTRILLGFAAGGGVAPGGMLEGFLP